MNFQINLKKGLATVGVLTILAGSLSACSVQPEFDNTVNLSNDSDTQILFSASAETLTPTPTPFAVVEPRPTPIILPIEEESIIKDNYKYVVVNGNSVNVRLDANTESMPLGQLNKGARCKSVATYKDWTIIDLNGNLGYIKTNFLDFVGDYSTTYKHRDCVDIVYSTSKIYFRSTPTTKENNKIKLSNGDLIPKNAEIEVVAETDNGWYLAKYEGKIGYVYAGNTVSLKEKLQLLFPEIKEVKVNKVVSLTTFSNLLYNSNPHSKVIKNLNIYQSAEVLGEENGYYFVKTNEGYGYINKNDTMDLGRVCVVIDLSDQEMKIYYNGEVVLCELISSGKKNHESPAGVFLIDVKQNGRWLISDTPGDEYKVWVDYWLGLNTKKVKRTGIGIHDITGRTMGEPKSHGCFSAKPETAKRAFDICNIGDNVNVQYYRPYIKELEKPFWRGYYNSSHSKR